ncbi:GBF-interacting protein 1-like [Iris pallida]|uniref:GBF-interacting protein 1-like n=1 Tax=Iris pallida TaxID=29817 RepID=A0AAX6GU27_IRIPA|nr:GBF-interacting protein 1-like [Iris pallida]KAJ6833676.1 GBF-interacting protein 1-like [Iris pallida]
MGSSSIRVSIPKSARPTIQNIKEIAGNHSDEEIYAMLKECAMDPNETAQKLLLQDTFHEVKRKRDKRKENNKEPAESRWRPALQGRGGRGGRGNYSSRYMSHDAGSGKIIGKENGIPQGTEKGMEAPSPPSHDTETKSLNHTASSILGLANGPTKVDNVTPAEGSISDGPLVSGTSSVEESSVTTISTTGMPPTGGIDTLKHEVGSQRSAVEATVKKVVSPAVASSDLSLTGKSSAEMNPTYMHGKMQGKSHGFDGNQLPDGPQGLSSLSRTSSAGSRPSSNYSNRSQQQSGPQRVGPAMEWKPKATNVKAAQASGTHGTDDVELITMEAATCTVPASSSLASESSATKLQKKLEELKVLDTKHVIIPNHLQVPESERSGLSFGSFDANFGLSTSVVNDTESDKSSAQLSEPSQEIEESVEEPISSEQTASNTHETDYADQPQSVPQMPELLSSREPEISSSVPTEPEYDQLKPEVSVAQEGSQYSVVHTAPTYSNFGFVPQILGNQFTTFEGAEPQARDATRIPSFVVQQPFDPSTNYYTTMYRPSADGDGRFSPHFAPGPGTKYNGNVVLPAPAAQSAQESANSLVLSSTGPAPLVTQPAGLMQSSLAVSQQSLPVFRQPAGVHIPHYPTNYIPYSQYFSPFYGIHPTIHPFLSNAAFPQQTPTGSIYPAPGPAAAAAPVKYAMPQYKPGTNTGNPSHVGTPVGYGTYSPNAVTSGNSSGSEDHPSSQYKENNVYIAGQQSEGSAVWIPTPGRDISAIQPTSFYNLPQGQHMTFPGMYHHPAQTVTAGTVHPMLQQSQAMVGTVEMVGPPAGVYQQPQRTWVNNY